MSENASNLFSLLSISINKYDFHHIFTKTLFLIKECQEPNTLIKFSDCTQATDLCHNSFYSGKK